MPSEEHTTHTSQDGFRSTEELHEELRMEKNKSEEERERETVSGIIVVGLMAVSGLVGVYSTAWFGTWPAQLAGGLFIAVLTFCSIVVVLYLAERGKKRVWGDSDA